MMTSNLLRLLNDLQWWVIKFLCMDVQCGATCLSCLTCEGHMQGANLEWDLLWLAAREGPS